MPEVPVRNDRADPDVGLQLRRDGGQVQAPAPVGRGGQVPELSAKEAEEEMRVYRYVTKDRYRLPVAQADSMGELAALIGPAMERFGVPWRPCTGGRGQAAPMNT